MEVQRINCNQFFISLVTSHISTIRSLMTLELNSSMKNLVRWAASSMVREVVLTFWTLVSSTCAGLFSPRSTRAVRCDRIKEKVGKSLCAKVNSNDAQSNASVKNQSKVMHPAPCARKHERFPLIDWECGAIISKIITKRRKMQLIPHFLAK